MLGLILKSSNIGVIIIKEFKPWHSFSHLFHIQHQSADWARGQGFLSLRKSQKMFEVYFNTLKNFKDQYYMVTPLYEVARASMYVV